MADPNLTTETAASESKRGFFKSFFIRNAPFILLLVLTVIGVAYTNIDAATSLLYWQAVVPVFALICIITQWPRLGPGQGNRIRLIWTQLLHWGALLLVMRLLFVHNVQKLLDSDITGLLLIYLLALSTFLGGVYRDWRLCVVGLFLGACAIAVAFVDQAALPMLIVAIVIVIALMLWSRLRG